MTNPTKLELLQKKLREIFQFEDQDLDFGIYRILNLKRKEISAFIDKELIEAIKEKIKTVEADSSFKEELEQLKTQIEDNFGCNIEEAKVKYKETPKVKDYILKEKESKKAEKENDIEEEIYDDIIDFFSRYYDRGDFISKRRYSKDSKYAIPYNGEEVYLYWANNDQYYIKTAENFKNYSFKVERLRVNFEVINEEVEVEKGNIKGEDKFFIFKDAEFDQKSKIVTIKFAYRPLEEEEKSKVKEISGKDRLGKDEVNILNLQGINQKIGLFGLSELQKKHIRMDGEASEKSKLEWHLNKYTTKNTTDYFIHKDLKKFLDQELDFYIKNELLHVDDISEKAELQINLNRIKVFKEISRKVIDFLAQIENFQRKLWEKKKFVVSTDYCITLDYIDEKYYPTILENAKQLEEWKKLFSFDVEEEARKLKGTLQGHGKGDKKIEVLKQNPTLVVDTKFFDVEFKYQLLSEIDDLDEKTNGILINSENFQSLCLLINKYRERIKCCYIDPPYNTGQDGFLYKDGFSHSSWIALMESRLNLLRNVLFSDSSVFISVDDTEYTQLKLLCNKLFDQDNFIDTLVWQKKVTPSNDSKYFSNDHEYVLCYANNKHPGIIIRQTRTEKQNEYYKNPDDDPQGPWNSMAPTCNKSKEERPNLYYSIIQPKTKKKIWPNPKAVWANSKDRFEMLMREGRVYWGRDGLSESPRVKIYLSEAHEVVPRSLLKYDEAGHTQLGTMELREIMPESKFLYPKPTKLVTKLLNFVDCKNSPIIDFFAGSGTTGHAVFKLNKKDAGNRKFILVEMGQYFETVLKPRIEKVIFSDNWKEGKPLDNNGSKKQIIKYQSLEQYEDTLNNIDFKEPNRLVYDTSDYKLKYMLEFESRSNNVFLNLDKLDNPFDYKLKIEKNNEIKEESIDLVETFNYIAGIDVKHILRKDNRKTKYLFIIGKRQEREVLVIWRKKDKNFDPKKEKEFIKAEFKEPFDEIYANGNSLIPNAKTVDEVFKANLFN